MKRYFFLSKKLKSVFFNTYIHINHKHTHTVNQLKKLFIRFLCLWTAETYTPHHHKSWGFFSIYPSLGLSIFVLMLNRFFFAENILKYEFHEYFSCFQRCFFRPNKGEEKIRYEFHYSVTHKHAHKWMRKNIEYSSQQQQQQQLVSLCACVWKFDFLIFKKNSHMESKLKNRKFLNSKLSL